MKNLGKIASFILFVGALGCIGYSFYIQGKSEDVVDRSAAVLSKAEEQSGSFRSMVEYKPRVLQTLPKAVGEFKDDMLTRPLVPDDYKPSEDAKLILDLLAAPLDPMRSVFQEGGRHDQHPDSRSHHRRTALRTTRKEVELEVFVCSDYPGPDPRHKVWVVLNGRDVTGLYSGEDVQHFLWAGEERLKRVEKSHVDWEQEQREKLLKKIRP